MLPKPSAISSELNFSKILTPAENALRIEIASLTWDTLSFDNDSFNKARDSDKQDRRRQKRFTKCRVLIWRSHRGSLLQLLFSLVAGRPPLCKLSPRGATSAWERILRGIRWLLLSKYMSCVRCVHSISNYRIGDPTEYYRFCFGLGLSRSMTESSKKYLKPDLAVSPHRDVTEVEEKAGRIRLDKSEYSITAYLPLVLRNRKLNTCHAK